jgi:hypothetical protein
MVDEKIIEAFYMIWDSFPGLVRLILFVCIFPPHS